MASMYPLVSVRTNPDDSSTNAYMSSSPTGSQDPPALSLRANAGMALPPPPPATPSRYSREAAILFCPLRRAAKYCTPPARAAPIKPLGPGRRIRMRRINTGRAWDAAVGRPYAGLAAVAAVGASMGALAGLAVWGGALDPTGHMADEARLALAEAAAYEEAAAATHADIRAFASGMPPGWPGGPDEYEAFMAASRDAALAAGEYAAALRAAADGGVSRHEAAELRAAEEAYMRADRDAHAALLDSPVGRMVEAGEASEVWFAGAKYEPRHGGSAADAGEASEEAWARQDGVPLPVPPALP